MTNSPLADAAIEYALNGLPVFPLKPRQKIPATSHGFKDATTELGDVMMHWRMNPSANIGIRPPEGIVVLDVDPRHGGDTELAAMTKFRGPLPETWTAHTGSGGVHFWYRIGYVPDLRAQLCTGVDIKAHNTGYVVAPPSIHPNGRAYEWITAPDGFPAEAPTWLRLAVQRPKALPPAHNLNAYGGDGHYSYQCLIARVAKAAEGTRNRVLYGACRDALHQGDLDAIEDSLIDAARSCGLDDAEIANTIRSARSRGASR